MSTCKTMSTVVNMTFSRARGVAERLREPLRNILSPHGQRHFSTSRVLAQADEEETNERKPWQEEATIYVHWPYCAKRCTYCNFNKYVSATVDHQRMEECLTRETETLLKMAEVKKVKSIYFGGGTPSLALPKTMESIINTVTKTTQVADNLEITMEANPTSTTDETLRDFKAAGINRVSLGLQTLHDKALRILGRDHDSQDAIKALEVCKRNFPNTTTLDIIFGIPGQTSKGLQHELKMIIPMADDHISLYQLTLEPGTPLYKRVMDRGVVMPNDDGMADMYEIALKMLEDNGYIRYEVSNFAASDEAESSHNKSYWRGDQYIGVGPGAHGRFIPWGQDSNIREARIQTLEPNEWMRQVEKHGHGTRKITAQTNRMMLEELLMLGLRTREGVSAQMWNSISTGPTFMDVFRDTYLVTLLVQEGFLEVNARGLKTTHRGLNVANSVTTELLNALSNFYELYGSRYASSS